MICASHESLIKCRGLEVVAGRFLVSGYATACVYWVEACYLAIIYLSCIRNLTVLSGNNRSTIFGSGHRRSANTS